MSVVHERRTAPWLWALIALLAIILIFVVWWAVSAENRQDVVVVPGPSQPATPPASPAQPPTPTTEQPAQPGQPTQPVVVQPQPQVNIYVQDKGTQPRVAVIPRTQQPPSDMQNATQVDLPGAFKYQNKTWTASDEAVKPDGAKLQRIGVSVDGRPVYADQGATAPYDSLYLETSTGSGIYLKYD